MKIKPFPIIPLIEKISKLIFFLMIIEFANSFFINKINDHYYQKFMNLNKESNSLPILFEKNNKLIQNYFIEKKGIYLLKYEKNNKKIDFILNDLENNIENDKKLKDYIRTIKNMYTYQKKHVNRLKKNINFDSNLFKEINFLNLRLTRLNNLSQLMSLDFFNFSSTNYYNFNNFLMNIKTLIFILILLSATIIVYFELKIIHNLSVLINELKKASKKLSNENWKIPDIKGNAYFEFDIILQTFNKMKNTLVNYIEELENKSKIEIELHKKNLKIEKKDHLIKETKLNALQMQMNPHFLFNTLNLIGRTAMLKNTDITSELIEAISYILRFNLENKSNYISLKEEIEILEKYIFIQENRFKNKIIFEMTNNCQINNIKIPPMIIQPLIENSIIHGFSKNNNILRKIKIEFSDNKNFLYIKIIDNGIGISEEKLKKILLKKNVNTQHKSIGINNIIKRLEFFYNNKNLLKIKSVLNKGTSVFIKIPLELKGVEKNL